MAIATSQPVATATSEPVATPTQSGPVILRFAISDNHNEVSGPYAQEFIDQVKELSDGEIILEPIWDSGDASKAGFEGRVIAQVKSGQADLGMAAARAWDTQDIPSFQALQAPFLIDNDALAEAVATSDIAGRMLADLSKYGITGLSLWPEDLRHPFSLTPDKPILLPTDFAGQVTRVTTSRATERLIEAFGGTPMYGGGYEVAESGLRQGTSLSGTPTATGNVTFFPKYQVLFVNGDAFGELSEAQQAILGEAAAAAQKKAIAEHPSEVEAATTWCSDFGAVVLASDEQIAEFEEAAQPVFDWIQQDPQNAELVAAIRELKAQTPASPAVQACEYELAQQIATSDASDQTWSTGLPPNGVWQVTLTNDDLIQMGVPPGLAPGWAGVYTLTILDSDFTWTWLGTEDYEGDMALCKGPMTLVDGNVSVIYRELGGNDCSGDSYGSSDVFQWRLDDQGLLHFHVVNHPEIELRAVWEAKPYQKIADQ
jgi:TRAP-type C4-dicarboxylate transport system substrate-binding protein